MALISKPSAKENVFKCLSEIRKREKEIGAFIEVFEEEALKRSEEIDSKLKKGKAGKLAGLVVAIKNNIAINGKRMTCASKMLENYVAPYDATVIERLLAEDAIIIGTTNLDEFACGSDTTNSALKKTRNPVDLQRVPGGSSGGSAAAVAAGFCDAALGSDTGGSIRCPASFCGVAGFKPTYGLVSRYGLADLAMTFDAIGPLAKDSETAGRILSVISGEDGKDTTTQGSKNAGMEKTSGKKMKIGIVKEFFEGCEGKIGKTVKDKISALEKEGHEIVELSFPLSKYALPIYYLLVYSEFSSGMQKYDGLRYGAKADLKKDLLSSVSDIRNENFGREVKRRILLGTYITSKEFKDQWYTKALKARGVFGEQMESLLKKCDVIASPAVPFLPWKIGERQEDPLALYLADVLTVPANICGIPAGVVNAGFVDKLPVGIQFMGNAFEDTKVLGMMKETEKLGKK